MADGFLIGAIGEGGTISPAVCALWPEAWLVPPPRQVFYRPAGVNIQAWERGHPVNPVHPVHPVNAFIERNMLSASIDPEPL